MHFSETTAAEKNSLDCILELPKDTVALHFSSLSPGTVHQCRLVLPRHHHLTEMI